MRILRGRDYPRHPLARNRVDYPRSTPVGDHGGHDPSLPPWPPCTPLERPSRSPAVWRRRPPRSSSSSCRPRCSQAQVPFSRGAPGASAPHRVRGHGWQPIGRRGSPLRTWCAGAASPTAARLPAGSGGAGRDGQLERENENGRDKKKVVTRDCPDSETAVASIVRSTKFFQIH